MRYITFEKVGDTAWEGTEHANLESAVGWAAGAVLEGDPVPLCVQQNDTGDQSVILYKFPDMVAEHLDDMRADKRQEDSCAVSGDQL